MTGLCLMRLGGVGRTAGNHANSDCDQRNSQPVRGGDVLMEHYLAQSGHEDVADGSRGKTYVRSAHERAVR